MPSGFLAARGKSVMQPTPAATVLRQGPWCLSTRETTTVGRSRSPSRKYLAEMIAHVCASERAYLGCVEEAARRRCGSILANAIHCADGILVAVNVGERRREHFGSDRRHALVVDRQAQPTAARVKNEAGALGRAIRKALKEACLKLLDELGVLAARFEGIGHGGRHLRG